MKNLLKILLFALLTVTISCEEMGIYNCNDCLETEPNEAYIEINLTPVLGDESYYQVRVYKGKIEDNILIDESRTGSSYQILGRINQEYSAIATRILDGVEYNAVNGTIPKVTSKDDYCETVCFIVTDDVIDLRIRYY